MKSDICEMKTVDVSTAASIVKGVRHIDDWSGCVSKDEYRAAEIFDRVVLDYFVLIVKRKWAVERIGVGNGGKKSSDRSKQRGAQIQMRKHLDLETTVSSHDACRRLYGRRRAVSVNSSSLSGTLYSILSSVNRVRLPRLVSVIVVSRAVQMPWTLRMSV